MDKELHCLVTNVYREARGESVKGKLAIALVTLNRVDSGKYPKTICGVVYQKNQFSWTKKYSKVKFDQKMWEESKVAALTAVLNRQVLGNFNATHFHNTSIRPNWKLKRVAKIGGHIFYGG